MRRVMKAASVGVVLAACVLLAGTYGRGGLDGPCLGGERARQAPEGSYIEAKPTWWPPGIRCTVSDYNSGTVLAERVFPGVWTWALAIALGALPPAITLLRRQSGVRRRSMPQ